MIGSLIAFAGPWLARAAPWLALAPGLGTLKRWAIAVSYAAVLGLGAWGGAKALSWWRGDEISIAEADRRGKAKCDATLADAALKAREDAVARRENSLHSRESEVESDAKRIAAYEKELEDARTNLSSGSAPFVSGDDGWLRAWQRRGR